MDTSSSSRDLALEVVRRASLPPATTIATAESCTGGLLAALLTSVPGASAAFLGGIVAYSNAVKVSQLGVPADLLLQMGAVSEQVALAMARGVRQELGAHLGVGITGVAGPGHSELKPPGLVYVAVASPAGARCERLTDDLGREGNRLAAASVALQLLIDNLPATVGSLPG
ncbi:MAG: CinA family protein [Candidatus Dormibacteraeota bacterium]|nr:CinA family protein [Candidatus Dormibacteraeota bacterium]